MILGLVTLTIITNLIVSHDGEAQEEESKAGMLCFDLEGEGEGPQLLHVLELKSG